MNLPTLIVAALLIGFGLPNAHSAETSPDLELEMLLDKYEREKLDLMVRLNTTYIERIEARLRSAMKEGNLPAANQTDRALKDLQAENDALILRRESADLIASLAGEWEILTTRYRFKVFPNGRVIHLESDEPYTGQRMIVVDLEKRKVRLNTITWEVTEGSKSLYGNRHPAQRIVTEN